MGTIPIDVSELVGRTPLVRFSRMAPEGVELYGKLEAFNPGGSVKDRIGVAMIEAAEREGRIEPGRSTIVEATSGNTGIALAFVCAAKGYDLVLTLPQGMSREREGLLPPLRRHGGGRRVPRGHGRGGERGAGDGPARRRLPARPVLQPGQPRGPPAHDGPRAVGAARREGRLPRVRRGDGRDRHGRRRVPQAPQPQAEGHRLRAAGLRGPVGPRAGAAPHPGHRGGLRAARAQRRAARRVIPVPDEAAIETARLAARTEGVLAGLSCGAALWGALQIAERPEAHGARIAVVLPDSGERYVSLPFFAS
jgi:cysteine synthase A